MYDAVIIGGGPGGSYLGHLLASKGYKVLVAEKRKAPGVPVRCGEGLGRRLPDDLGLKIPDEAIGGDVTGGRLFGPKDEAITMENEGTKGWILERRVFDKVLLEMAAASGAEVLAGTEVMDVRGNVAELQGPMGRHEVEARTIISAEGMEARIARKMGVVKPASLYDVDVCYEVEVINGDFEPYIDIYLGNKRAPRGYVWVFPKGENRANIGVGVGGHLDVDPKPLLFEFLKKYYSDVSIVEEKGGVISVGGLQYPLYKGNFAVIGTAARQVDPVHGGGIAMALESASFVAQTFEESLERGDFEPYERLWKEKTGKKYADRLRLRHVLEKMSDEDLSFVFNALDDKKVAQVLAGDFIPVVTELIAKRPSLLTYLKALLSQ